MIILKPEQVKYGKLIREIAGETETRLGLFYNNKLFIKEKTFNKDHKEEAIKRSKELTINLKGRICLIIEDPTEFTLWSQTDDFKVPKSASKSDPIPRIDLEKLVAAMRTIGGVKIQDRRYRLTMYKQCFIGREAVDYLVKKLKISRPDAVRLGQRLIDKNLIHHVTDDHEFKDENLFYRFYWDE